MKKLILVLIIGILLFGTIGCRTTVERSIDVKIYVFDDGVVYFTPEVMAEIVKRSDVEKKLDIDGTIKAH